MAKEYIASKMMVHSRFSDYFRTESKEGKEAIESRVAALIEENRSYCVPISYAHLCNLFCAIAVYEKDIASGMKREDSCRRILEIMKTYLAGRKKMFQIFFKIPGMFAVGRKMIPRMMMKGNGFGWHSEEVDLGKYGMGFDTTECIFATLMNKYGYPELGCTFCLIDDYLYSELPGIRFERKGTVCRGDRCCDFRFHKEMKA